MSYISDISENLPETERVEVSIFASIISGLLGDIEKSSSEAKEAFRLASNLGKPDLIIGSYYALAEVLLKERNYPSLEDLIRQGLSYIEGLASRGDSENYWYCRFIRVDGIYHFSRGDLTSSIQIFRDAYQVAQSIGDEQIESQILGNIAVVQYYLGEVDASLDAHLRAIAMMEAQDQSENYNLAGLINNIGLLYYSKNEPELALNYFKRSIDIFRNIGNNQFIILNYHNIVRTLLLMAERETAGKYLAEIKSMAADDKYSNLIMRLTNGLYLKSSLRLRDKAKAQSIFENIIEADIIDYQFTQQAMYNLTEMLIDELEKYGDEKIVEEISNVIDQLNNIARKHGAQSVLAETHLLGSRLALLEGNVEGAKQLLEEGIIIAQGKGLRTLASVISKHLDELIETESFWHRISPVEHGISDRVEVSEIKYLMTQLVHNQLVTGSYEEEIPVIFLIVTDTGLPIHFRKFQKSGSDVELNEVLISNFITAIDLFGRETFKTTHFVERIQFKDQMIIMKIYESVVFIYSFKGPSYSATEKLDKFIQTILASDELFRRVINFEMSISLSTQRQLDQIIDSIFVPKN